MEVNKMCLCKWFSRCAIVCLLGIVFIAAQATAQGELELLIPNPDFEEDFKDWTQYVNAADGAAATFAIDKKDPIEGQKCAYIKVTNVSGTNWHVGLTQDGLTLKAGKMHTVDFFAKADAKRIIDLEFKRSPGQGDWEGITDASINITDQWEEYFHSFTPAKDYKTTAFFGFWLGQVKGEIWIDGVRIYEGKKQEREETVPPKSVQREDKLVTSWAAIKSVH
jgi:hypothetical protein